MFNELIITLAIIIIGIILLTYAFYQFIYSPKKIPKLLIILLICIPLSMHSLKNLSRLIKEDILLNKESNTSIQKVIIENEDKIEAINEGEDINEYRTKIKTFLIHFKTYLNKNDGKVDCMISTNPSKIIKYLDDNEISDGVYRAFKENILN